MGMRVHLCGRIALVGDNGTIDERELPGRQGRLALALLCLDRRRPVSVDRLIDALWDELPPPDAAGALASIVSKLRTILRRAGAPTSDVISAGAGTYQLRLPAGSTVDVEDARTAIDQAEGARRRGNESAAWAHATVAVAIARRGFLAGESAGWAMVVQREVDRIARRGFDCLAWVWTVRGEGVLATAMAERAVELEPLHEPAWRALMATQAQFGSRADAVRTYARCRDLLRDELGVSPDAETDRLYSQLLAT
jgi:DNA-binding SARP family transcriptional activator